jgi:hypothetical protein
MLCRVGLSPDCVAKYPKIDSKKVVNKEICEVVNTGHQVEKVFTVSEFTDFHRVLATHSEGPALPYLLK